MVYLNLNRKTNTEQKKTSNFNKETEKRKS